MSPVIIPLPRPLIALCIQGKAKLSEDALKKQSEANMRALDDLMTENKRLREEVRFSTYELFSRSHRLFVTE